MKNYTFILLLLINTLSYAAVNSNVEDVERYESLTLPNTQIRHIESEYTKKDYRIYVNIPADYYQNPNKKYSAIYLLDADYSFPIAKTISEHLQDRQRISDFFIFGIAYDDPARYKLNRTQDYTPTHVAEGGYGTFYQRVSGGGPEFEKFLQKELIPYLNKSYRLNQNRTIVGHSYGGLFATWLSLQNQNLFHNYIIVSPSLWYDDHFMFNVEKQYENKQDKLPEKIFFGIGDKENNGTYRMVDDLNNFTNKLKDDNYNQLEFTYTVFKNEDHDTVFPTAFTAGILYIYGQ